MRLRSRHTARLTLTALVPAIALTLTSCSTPTSAQPDTSVAIGLSDTIDCLDPHQTPATPALHVARQLVANLTDQDPKTGEIVPWLATSWKANADATQFEFTLREGATYADGTAIDAVSVVANFDDIVKLGARSPLGSSYLAGYTGAKAVDTHTVSVKFDKPSAQFLQATAMVTLGLLSPKTLAADAAARCAGSIVGSGPFTVAGQVQNESVTLAARKDFAWGSALATHQGAPLVDRLEFRIVTDASSRHGSLLSGSLDVDTQVLPQDQKSLEGQLLSGTRPGIVYTFLPNLTRATLADQAVRRALSLAINRDALVPLLSSGERAATDVLASTTPGYQNRGRLLAYDPQAAADLLDGDGWVLGADGVRAKGGKQLSLELIYSANEPYSSVYQEISKQAAEVGIKLILSPLDAAANSARQDAGDYDIVSWAVTRADPSILATIYPVGSANPIKRKKADSLDAAIAAIAGSIDPKVRQQSVNAAAEGILTSAYGIPLFEQAASIGVAKQLVGVRLDSSARPIFADAQVQR